MDEYHDMIGVAKSYFQAFAVAGDVEDQLAPDLEFFYPGHGLGQGAQAYARMTRALSDYWERIDFDSDNFSYVAAGHTIVVEGTVSGVLPGGVHFRGHRFCAVLEIRDLLIRRLYFYLDPDLGGQRPSPVDWSVTSC